MLALSYVTETFGNEILMSMKMPREPILSTENAGKPISFPTPQLVDSALLPHPKNPTTFSVFPSLDFGSLVYVQRVTDAPYIGELQQVSK